MPKFSYHPDGVLPILGEIFVFGSNLAGIHGAGAAKEAIRFGAVVGEGIGLVGNTYAIPTKDEKISTLPLKQIEKHLRRFILYTHQNKGKKFFVTRIGCGLAGYSDDEIAPLFLLCYNNCCMPINWKPYLEVTTPLTA